MITLFASEVLDIGTNGYSLYTGHEMTSRRFRDNSDTGYITSLVSDDQ